MKVTVLGSGTAAPRLERNMSSYLVEVNGLQILFDSGPGTIRQLLKQKKKLQNINHIFYTHFHNDHINDLPAIIWSNNYGLTRTHQLNLYGPKRFKAYVKTLLREILQPPTLNFKIKVKGVSKPTTLKGVRITAQHVKHTFNSVAYAIQHKGKKLVYSGDTDYCPEIVKIAKNADILILECSLPNNQKVKGHLTPKYCGKIATAAKVKHLVLTHFYPECDRVDAKKHCKKEFAGKITAAKDFLQLRV